jgi:hypothetical protein
MVENIENGTLLGKCAIDGNPIYQGSGIRSKHAVVLNGRWLSGDTILKIYPTAFQAFLDDNKHQEKEKEMLLESLGKYGWQVNPDTGKLEKL